jgi:hypothetical protein
MRPSYRRHLLQLLLVLASTVVLLPPSIAAADMPKTGIDIHIDPGAPAQSKDSEPTNHMKVSGVVSKVQAGLVTVKTPTGHYTVGLKAIAAFCKVGDRVTMYVNEGNTVIDIQKGDNPRPHRFIAGTLTYVADDHNEILMWTPDGEKRFAVTASRSKLSTIKEGTPIMVELNDTGDIIDVHQMQ